MCSARQCSRFWRITLCPHHGASLRWRAPRVAGHEEDQRGRGAPGLQGHREDRRAESGCSTISIIARRRSLSEPWISTRIRPSSCSTAIRKGPVLGYNNPKKPGRPSHVYHTYTMAGLRLALDVEVAAGNEHASKACVPRTVGALGSHSARLLAGIFCAATAASVRKRRRRLSRAERASRSVQAAPYR